MITEREMKERLFDLFVARMEIGDEVSIDLLEYYKAACLPILGLQKVIDIAQKAEQYVKNHATI